MVKIAGVMTVKNGILFDYPFIESARSIMSICDEFVFVEGYSDDDTLKSIEAFSDEFPNKIKIVRYRWDKKHYTDIPDSTNAGIEAVESDYYINLQADEIMHEKYLGMIKNSIENDPADLYETKIIHFWSSFDLVYKPKVFYDYVQRIARRDRYPDIVSIWDGMTLGSSVPDKIRISKSIPACIYHYGYVRKPNALYNKAKQMLPWWGYEFDKRFDERDYKGNLIWDNWHPKDTELTKFDGTHPLVMKAWIEERRESVEAGAM